MGAQWGNVFFFLFMVAWGTGILVLGLRANAKGKAYLRRLPPVKGIPLDMYMYGENDWFRGWRGPVWQAYRQPQTDPELEELRREARRRGRHVVLWLFGFPTLVVGAVALLIISGVVR